MLFLSILLFSTLNNMQETQTELAIFGGGCFWCTEAIFADLEGVLKVEPGYSGGFVKNPSYKEVCTGRTGHAEAIRITFEPDKISFNKLLEVFFFTHDPTTLNRQGADSGTQYRSAVFYTNEKQKASAEEIIRKLNENQVYDRPIVTEITPFSNFYLAEDYHQNYYKNNSSQPYCRVVIQPKMEKFRKVFNDDLKK